MQGSGRMAMRVARLAALSAALLVAAPATSGAAPPATYRAKITVAQEPGYVGWLQVHDLRPGNAAPSTGHPAWRWSGRSWQRAEARWGTWLYVQPFAPGWSLGWTSSGWLAIEPSALYLRTETRPCSEEPVDPMGHAQACRGINF